MSNNAGSSNNPIPVKFDIRTWVTLAGILLAQTSTVVGGLWSLSARLSTIETTLNETVRGKLEDIETRVRRLEAPYFGEKRERTIP